MVATIRLIIAYCATLLFLILGFWEGALAFAPTGITTTTASSIPRLATNFLFHNGHTAIKAFALSFASSNSNNHEGPPKQRKLYEMVNGTRTTDMKTFEENLAALKQYKKDFGTANIPQQYRYRPDHPFRPLSMWVHNMRNRGPRIAEEQRKAMDKIGFSWNQSNIENRNRRWEDMYQRLCDFNATNGHSRVPTIFKQDQTLATWARWQRRMYKNKNLSSDKIDRLNMLKFVWSIRSREGKPLDKPWQRRYKQLVQYKKKYNHTNVPWTMDKKDPYYSLGLWVSNQRQRFVDKTLLPYRKRKLDDIGFLWSFDEVREAEWLRMYNLCKLKRQGGKVPFNDVQTLRSWEKNQRGRESKGTLDKRRKAMLDDIDFRWEIQARPFISK